MQLTNAPGKLVLPFANSGAKNAIPVASQIGITAGAASLTDGFPPLTRTPLAAGGVPPSGLDMNGIIYELSAILRWSNAGGGYVFDGTFAADSNVGGYPKGARVLRSDGLGYWFNTTDNNTTDPEGVGAVAAGWVPDFTNGVAAVTMTGSNVTLTALQYGKPIIVISGLLTANLNLIFPNVAGNWVVINNTTGAFIITAKTAAGTGVAVSSVSAIVGDATNIYQVSSGITQAAADLRYLQLSGGTLTGLLIGKTGANIASAATLNLATATGNTVHITGTAATSAVTMVAGQWMQCIADGAWPLTYHATNNKLNTGGANYTCAAGDSVFFFYDGTTVYAQIVKADGTAVIAPNVGPIRQTVLSGPVDSNGHAAFGGATGATTVTAAGTLIATVANGFNAKGQVDRIGSITNPSWTGLSTNGTMYLYLDIASDGTCTPGVGTLAPAYQFGGTYSVTNNQFTFNIQEMVGKVGNGSTAAQTYRIYVGEVTVAGGVVTAIIWYQLEGKYQSAWVNTLPSAVAPINANHKLGIYPKITTMVIECITNDASLAVVGERINNPSQYSSDRQMPPSFTCTRNSMKHFVGAGNFFLMNSASYSLLTAANWKYAYIAERGW